MDDLISREAAIEALKIPNGEYPNPSERHGIIIARVEARRRIREIPSIEAVPLELLCQWLAGYAAPPLYALEGKDGWDLLFVGNRMLELSQLHIEKVWAQLCAAQIMLQAWYEDQEEAW